MEHQCEWHWYFSDALQNGWKDSDRRTKTGVYGSLRYWSVVANGKLFVSIFTSENLGSPDFWIRSIECDPEICSKLFVFSFLPTCNKFLTKIFGNELNGIKFFHYSKNFLKLNKRKYLYITKIKRITWTAELIAGLMDRTNNSQEH